MNAREAAGVQDSAGRLKRTAWQARYADAVDRRKRVEKTFATAP